MLTIGTLASSRIIAVTPDTYASDAAGIMSNLRISCLLVLHKGALLGIITERDLVFSASRIIGFADLEVRDIMSGPVLTAAMTTPFKTACRLLLENNIRHLVLLDNAEEVEGVVTPTDLVRVPGFERCLGDRQVAELMNPHVSTASEKETARYALARMTEDPLAAIVVLDGQIPRGIFTCRDVARLISQGPESWNAPLARVMRPVITISPATTLREANATMRQQRVRKLLVVDGEGKLLGLFGQGALVSLLDRFCGGEMPLGERSPACGFPGISAACR